jgi:hypothetical protein
MTASPAPLPPWEETPAEAGRRDRDYWEREYETDDET